MHNQAGPRVVEACPDLYRTRTPMHGSLFAWLNHPGDGCA